MPSPSQTSRNYARAVGVLEGAVRSALACLESGNRTEAQRALRAGLTTAERIAGPSGVLSTPPHDEDLVSEAATAAPRKGRRGLVVVGSGDRS